MKRAVLFGILIVFCVSLTGCQKTYQKGIAEINFYHSTFGRRSPEFKIDFAEKKFWKYTREVGSSFAARDSSAENEGYTFVCDLRDDAIDAFLSESAQHGFTKWKTEYVDKNIFDGHQWGATITFADSATLVIQGSNAYPSTWDNMHDAFIGLTGEDILLFKTDWLNA